MSTDKEIGEGNPELDPIEVPVFGKMEREVMDRFVVAYAKDISGDGGRTAKGNGYVIVLDQPTAQPKNKNT